jgi:uncharacterized peroxidase-related enzyme
MTYIKLNNEHLPGIIGLLNYRPETAKPLKELAETLLRNKSTLTKGERELIAASVSYWNDCKFCYASHGASAAAHMNRSINLLDDIRDGMANTEISDKLFKLLRIARKVQVSGKEVNKEDIEQAKEAGASDMEIHDTVLLAAAFCMYNRYVDGLNTWAPEEREAYIKMGQDLAENGYMN